MCDTLNMARMRILLENGGCYHVVSRIVERRFYFGEREKEFFVGTMRRLEAFLDVKVLTFCVMSNHFHLLLEVPGPDEKIELSAESLRARLPLLYHGQALAEARDEIDRAMAVAAAATGTSTWIDGIVARYQERMGNLSIFLKELKWRFSRWYNEKHDRLGTLWEDRFRSIVVEGNEHALMTMAAYIELNPLRAALVEDPMDYRWSGYGEAMAGKKLARRRLARLHGRMRAWQGAGRPPVSWREVGAAYRCYLFGQGEMRLGDGRTGSGAKVGIAPRRVDQVIDREKGRIPLAAALRKRVRHFVDGAVFGSAEFVDNVFEAERWRFGEKRKTGARKMPEATWGGLSTLRDFSEEGLS